MLSPTPTSIAPTTRLAAIRRIFTTAGAIALGAVGISVAMFAVALALGVHCPECARDHLGTTYHAWRVFFCGKDTVAIAGGFVGFVSLLFADRRRWGAIAVASFLASIVLTPM